MGSCQTKNKTTQHPAASEKAVQGLKEKVKNLQSEINEIMRVREAENQVYERELMVFAFKQAEWKRERKGLKDEIKKLKNNVNVNTYNKGSSGVFDQVQLQATRDETVEKWKHLYFAIKVELDHLIHTTHQEERLRWKRVEEDVLEEVKKELISKDKKIEVLESKIASMENQELRREREMDILRQSLRIMSHKNRSTKLGHKSIQG